MTYVTHRTINSKHILAAPIFLVVLYWTRVLMPLAAATLRPVKLLMTVCFQLDKTLRWN